MTKKKMCQWIDRCFYKHNRTMLVDKSVCPKRVNDKCQIIPAKPKVVKVKAWAVLMQVQVNKTKDTWETRVDYASHKPDAMFVSVPCTITIAKKHLKPAKGEK